MKFIKISLRILIIAGGILLITQKFWVSPLVKWIIESDNSAESQLVEVVKNRYVNEDDTFETLNINPSDIKSFGNINPITFSNNSHAVSFKGTVVEARNPGSYVYLNETKLGAVEGQGVIKPFFSKDNNFFTFSTVSVCGAGCVHKRDYQIDLISSTLK